MPGHLLTELETPALCLDLAILQERVRLLADGIQRVDKKWRPPADWHSLPGVSREQVRAGACGLSTDSLKLAARFAAEGFQDIHLAQPAQASDLLWNFLRSFPDLTLSVSCDHYAQAEDLSDMARYCGRQIPVLIELNLGRSRFGIRSGLDCRNLARGIARLPGVIVRGLSANLGRCETDEVAASRCRSAVGMLQEAQESLLQDGLCCDVISLAAEGVVDPVLKSPLITEIRSGDHFTRNPAGVGGSSVSAPLLMVIASVFSRSKLERAILDVGQSQLGVRTPEEISVRSTATGRPLPDAKCEALEWNSLTLELGPCSRDLIIGNRVLLDLVDPRFSLQLFSAVHVTEKGLINGVWPPVPVDGTALTGTAGQSA